MGSCLNTLNSAEYQANTCVRIAYKVFEMDESEIPFSLGSIDFTQGTIAVSGKEKFDQLKDWPNSPFHEYQ